MNWVISAGLIIAGVIHLLPVPGLIGSDWLTRLYGVVIVDRDLTIMMRHRALLFGLLGLFLVAAAFRPDWQWLALAAGLVSAIGFIVIAQLVGDYSTSLFRVVLFDIVAIVALAIAGIGLIVRGAG